MLSVGRCYSKYCDKFAEELRSHSIFCGRMHSKKDGKMDAFKKIKCSIEYKFIIFDKLNNWPKGKLLK